MNTDNARENDGVDGGLTVPISEQELLAARITAHALGELDAAERAEVERLLADQTQTDARSQVAEVRAIAAALKATSDEDAPTRSADLRRAVLAAAAASPSAGSSTVSRRGTSRRPWGMLASLASLAAAVTVMATVFFSRTEDHQVAMHEKRNLAIESARAPAMKGAAARATAEVAPVAAPVPATAPVAVMAPSPAMVLRDAADAPPAEAAVSEMKPADARSRKCGTGLDRAMAARERAMPAPSAAASPAYQGQPRSSDDMLAHVIPSPARRELPAGGEGYATFSENRFLASREQPLSTFSIDVDTASYANVRRFLASGRRPPWDAVRVEELVNSFRYDYPQPEGDVPFSVTVDATQCPWNASHRLVRIGLQGKQSEGFGTQTTIAKDVKVQVEFNPAQVASYRLLGYENRALADRDFRDDTKDAGEIGAGHAATALYEIALVGEEAASGSEAEPFKYQPQPETREPAVAADASEELLTVKLRWKRPDGDTSTLTEVPLEDRGGAFDTAPADLRFAAAVAGFGMILRESDQKGDATLAKVAKIAAGALGRDEGGYRAEFLDLVRKAESLQ